MLGADDVVAAVDVDDFAGGGGEEIRQEGDARAGDGLGVFDVPSERCAFVPFKLTRARSVSRRFLLS